MRRQQSESPAAAWNCIHDAREANNWLRLAGRQPEPPAGLAVDQKGNVWIANNFGPESAPGEGNIVVYPGGDPAKAITITGGEIIPCRSAGAAVEKGIWSSVVAWPRGNTL